MKKIFKEAKSAVRAIGVAIYAILIIVVGNVLFKICYVADFVRGKNPMNRINNAVTYVKEKIADDDATAVLKALYWPIKI